MICLLSLILCLYHKYSQLEHRQKEENHSQHFPLLQQLAGEPEEELWADSLAKHQQNITLNSNMQMITRVEKLTTPRLGTAHLQIWSGPKTEEN